MQIKLVVKKSDVVSQMLMPVAPKSTPHPRRKCILWYQIAEWWLCSVYAVFHETLAIPFIIISVSLCQDISRRITLGDQRSRVGLCRRVWINVACVLVILRAFQHLTALNAGRIVNNEP